MIRIRDTRYDDPEAVGSLRGALNLWRVVAHGDTSAKPYSMQFTYTCRGEARARRVVYALRRRTACAAAQTAPSSRLRSELWHVHGTTRPQIQSLTNLERLSNWLRNLAGSHQVNLVRLTLV
ncbi:MAG TPA: hypothetical protein VNL98_13120 [Gemmatimonadales bacterium]|nr:hypothetical protein [Gemmatimonadales bacterium]